MSDVIRAEGRDTTYETALELHEAIMHSARSGLFLIVVTMFAALGVYYLLELAASALFRRGKLKNAVVLLAVIRFRPSGVLGWFMHSRTKQFIDEKILRKPSLDILEEVELMEYERKEA